MNNKVMIYLDSLGCAKNLVDSEYALGLLDEAGFGITADPFEAQVVLVNTCGFINDAKEESIERILELAQLKEENCLLLVVTGCLSQRYGAELQEVLPEIDLLFGTAQYEEIADAIKAELKKHKIKMADTKMQGAKRILITPKYSAYLKVAEGCNNACSFCAIPNIRGRLISLTVEEVIAEAKRLQSEGVKELALIAQDTTAYGLDNYGKRMLPTLVDEVDKLGFDMVRLLYCYPDGITDELLEALGRSKTFCHYLDIPLQHISGNIIKNMNRHYDVDVVNGLFEKIRKHLPDVAIRTTFMVGFPGETDEDFEELLAFAKATDLAWAGVFMYSPEEDTPAASMENQVDDETKARRYNRLSAVLALKSGEHKGSLVGKEVDVLLCEPSVDYGGYFEARSQFNAPEVDGVVLVENMDGKLTEKSIGKIVKVRIHTAETYDVIGKLV